MRMIDDVMVIRFIGKVGSQVSLAFGVEVG